MREYKKETIAKGVLNTLTCDKCGKKDEDVLYSDITSFDILPGFGSRYDDNRYTVDLCDNCLKEVILPYAKLTD